jgi:hypothetical protein
MSGLVRLGHVRPGYVRLGQVKLGFYNLSLLRPCLNMLGQVRRDL